MHIAKVLVKIFGIGHRIDASHNNCQRCIRCTSVLTWPAIRMLWQRETLNFSILWHCISFLTSNTWFCFASIGALDITIYFLKGLNFSCFLVIEVRTHAVCLTIQIFASELLAFDFFIPFIVLNTEPYIFLKIQIAHPRLFFF